MSGYEPVSTSGTELEFDVDSEDKTYNAVSMESGRRVDGMRQGWHGIHGLTARWPKAPVFRVLLCLVAGIMITLTAFSILTSKSHSDSHAETDPNPFDTDWELPRPSVIVPLQELCSSKAWHEGLYFSCYNSAGGLGNTQAFVLDYVRFAIEAGATGLILPMIQRRGTDLKAGTLREGIYEPFSYMFDEDWFIQSIQLSCPQMTVLRSLTDIPNFDHAHFPDVLEPISMQPEQFFNTKTAEFGSDLLTWLGYTPSAEKLTVVRLQPGIFEFPTGDDSPALYASIGRILRMNNQLQSLAARVFRAVRQAGSSRDDHAYLGAHLRVEADLTKFAAEWPTYEVQRDSFFSIAAEKDLTLMYVASGDLAALERVREESVEKGIAVVTKYDLLSETSLQELNELTFDQQGIVDYLVLRNSTFFVGTAPSSFSYEIAYSRHLDVSELTRFSFPMDERSKINGADFGFFTWGMWPLIDCLGRTG